MEYLKNLFKHVANNEVIHLELPLYRLDEELSRLLVEALQKNKSIKTIKLYFLQVHDAYKDDLLKAIGSLRTATGIEINGGNFSESSAKGLLSALRYSQGLEILSIQNIEMSHNLAKTLSLSLPGMKSLQTLKLEHTQLVDQELDILAHALKTHPKLCKLSLWLNELTDDSAEQIAAIITENQHMTEICVESNQKMGPKSIEILKKAILLNESIVKYSGPIDEELENIMLKRKVLEPKKKAEELTCDFELDKYNEKWPEFEKNCAPFKPTLEAIPEEVEIDPEEQTTEVEESSKVSDTKAKV